MPKKKNAFWTFFVEYKRDHNIKSQEEAMKRADAVWRNMSSAERNNYTPKKETVKPASLREIEIKCNEEVVFHQTMVEEITSELAMAKKYNNLSSYRFYIIHVNSFCYHDDFKRHYPCEIGISSFTLKDGVSSNVYHSMVYPGPLPNGYSSSARLVSENSHQIPWEFDDEDNTNKIFDEVIDHLLERSKGSSKLPILYTRKKDMELVKNVLDTWCDYYNPRVNFTVYNVQTLFSLLHKNIITETWSSESLSYIELEKDVHSFAPGITCEYHDSADVQIYCSRSIAVRIGYTICQNCCPGLDIDLIPGQHIPSDMKVHKTEEGSFSQVRTKQIQDESTCSVRVDSSDGETISSFERTTSYEEDTDASSIDFPEYDNSSVSSEKTIIYKSSGGNHSNETSQRTGSSGFSRKPAVLPSNVNDNFGKLTISQESREGRPGVMPSLRGRGGGMASGKGRGHPFKK